MLVGFVDAAGSTDAAEREGSAAQERLTGQLDEIAGAFRAAANGGPFYLGNREGDGFNFAAPRERALDYVRAAMRVQATTWMHAGWIPLYVSLGLATPTWHGTPWTAGSTFSGRDVTIIARLLKCELPGRVLITEAIWWLLWERAAHLRPWFRAGRTALKGFADSVPYWISQPQPREADMREKMMIGLLGGMLLLLVAHAGWAWQSSRQFSALESISQAQTTVIGAQTTSLQMQRASLEKLESSIGALIWTLCETSPSCRPRNSEEPAYMRYLRELNQRQSDTKVIP